MDANLESVLRGFEAEDYILRVLSEIIDVCEFSLHILLYFNSI